MFSFTNALNPSPHFPSSSYHPLSPPAFSEHDPDDMFFHQHQCESLCGSFLPINGSFPQNLISFPVAENPTVTGQNNGDPLGDSEFLAKIPVKKDRHSKIYTSRGLRDRRVRLSIDIARNFFDLQDMLGFDKASTTLDWLLTKSRKAIEEVARMKKGLSGCAKNLSSSSECEVVSGENLAEIISKSGSLAAVSKEKKMKGTDEATAHILAKESRAKARARARERAREKMRTGMLPESEKCLQQFRPLTQPEACERSSKVVAQIEPSYLLLPDQGPRANVTEESIAIRRKLKSPGRLLYQPNLVIPKDLSSSSQNSSSFPNLPVNCAIPVMNLSKELHIRGKAIEGSISQRFA